ncbi:TetR/AcrR family transcriptional regulator C-terminal domain-containing protein [Streptomyces alanosinicus]|uniref:TetR family transcriptional regulator n=1 Tax=Streptomyces alanosinicus TaxID=68171 RepID=A0A918YMF2_9ACTN|nr:TetR/AcrR family transcriptional regulator C-terminal domain-containing protein [Streptomyces alanosinicus]GHE08109.1 TetR family transcriptional regulator [Streptomyces alanosinicus]
MGERKRGAATYASVWLTPPARQPGPPGLSRDRIVRTAVELLDTEGLQAVSMRRVAAQLGAGHMSLYWHVTTKGALLELALDEAFGEVVAPPDDLRWDEQLRALAGSLRAVFARHRWAARLIGEYLNIGPNALRMTDTALRVVSGSGLAPDQTDSAAALVLEYVCGFATAETRMIDDAASAERNGEQSADEGFAEVSDAVRSGFTEFASLRELASRDIGTATEIRDRNFAFGLQCIIAGLKALADTRETPA